MAIQGVSSFYFNGVPYTVAMSASHNAQTQKNEWVPNWQGAAVFANERQPGKIVVKLVSDGSYSPQADFVGVTGATASITYKNGMVVTCSDGWTEELGDIDAKDGTFDLTINSLNITEVI